MIPTFNHSHVLPPYSGDSPKQAALSSPYETSAVELVSRLGSTRERRALLSGLFAYRQALRDLGFVQGFQWLDGSFLEDVETLERRFPRDIDVVTFLRTPAEYVPSDDDIAVLNRAKVQFYVDAYFVELDELSPDVVVAQSAYWYSMWSHRRNQAWKGFLQIDLAATDDVRASHWLAQHDAAGVQS